SVFIFFCQAEAGIRDRNVTGVQTCALPISTSSTISRQLPNFPILLYLILKLRRKWKKSLMTVPPFHCSQRNIRLMKILGIKGDRSEERRVGKECRGGGWT